MSLDYKYQFWRMTSLFNRSLFIKYYKDGPSIEGAEFQGFEGAVEGDANYDDQGQDNNFMNDMAGGDDIDVNFEEGTMHQDAFNHFTQAMDNNPASMFRHRGPLNQYHLQSRSMGIQIAKMTRNMDVRKVKS